MQVFTLTSLMFLSTTVFANETEVELEKKVTQEEYVARWSSEARNQMNAYRIPASITLAQGILESGNGNSPLAKEGNNHFGIKCHDWQGERMFFDDDKKQECFRKYPQAEASYRDHSLFLTGRTRYAKLFDFPLTDYKSWAFGLKDAGYATSTKYPAQLIELIEKLQLYRFDDANLSSGNEQLAAEISKPSSKELSVLGYQAHSIKEHKNKLTYIVARRGDTYYKIAKEFNMGRWQLYRYNDFGPKKDLLQEGDIVYLEPKRRRSKEKHGQYVASERVSLINISQSEGIKIESLMKKNGFSSTDVTVEKGQKVRLR